MNKNLGKICTKKSPHLRGFPSGKRGIRTLGDISATLDFESSALDQLSHLSLPCTNAHAGDYDALGSKSQALFEPAATFPKPYPFDGFSLPTWRK